jgi:hypothetical protein
MTAALEDRNKLILNTANCSVAHSLTTFQLLCSTFPNQQEQLKQQIQNSFVLLKLHVVHMQDTKAMNTLSQNQNCTGGGQRVASMTQCIS